MGDAVAVVERRDDVERLEVELLLDALARHAGFDFRGYAPASLARRIQHAMRTEGVTSVSQLQHHVLRDPDALARVVRTLTVHVTSMFRDGEFYRDLRARVIPHLRTYPFVRIWHAGCSTGEEAYSLAILLTEEGIYERTRIYATDISEDVLARARRGIYPLDAIRRYTEAYLRAGGRREFSSYYVADQGDAILTAPLRRNILFSQHDLAADGSFNEFHLILCRNVMIYFGDELRARALALLDASLVRRGFLGLGRKERLDYTTLTDRYQALPGDTRLYRRTA